MMVELVPETPAPSPDFPPRRALPPFASLRAFDAVARLGGVRRAADALSLDHAVISRHLRAIEEWIGVPLIVRTRGGVALTEEGRRYHKVIGASIDAIAGATLDLMAQSDENRLHIWCMPGFASQWLIGRLAGFRAANGGLRLDLRPAELGPDFARREADVDIRYAPTYGAPITIPASARTIELAEPPVFPVASPEYLARSAPVRRVADFLDHALIHEENFENWRAWLAAHGLLDLSDVAGARLWHGHLTMDAARRGHGIVLANHFLAHDDLAAGRLVEVTGADGPFAPVRLGSYLFVARSDRWASPPIARFRNWLTAAVRAEFGGEWDDPDGGA